MTEDKFSWVETHKQISDYLSSKEKSQIELIHLLKSVGIGPLNDKSTKSGHDIELEEIDPFTFFCYIYKHGPKRRLELLQKISEKLSLKQPNGESGIPSSQAQKVWLFPYKFERKNNEIARLWSFFKKARANEITNNDFADVLQIRNTGKTKLTEALFYIDPERFLPINRPTKPYLLEVLGINPSFDTYTEYKDILDKIRSKSELPFYKLSFEAWKWNEQREKLNFWIFQGNPKVFDFETALRENIISDWTVSAHKDKIKIGDKVILWITGSKSGCYALAEVINEPHQKTISPADHLWKEEIKGELKAGIRVTHNLVDNPILNDDIIGIEELKDLKIGNQGTNFSATEEEFETLLEMAENKTERNYWLYAPGENAYMWDEFFDLGIMALGWDEIGDLKQYNNRQEIKKALENVYGGEGSKKNDVSANDDFVNRIKIGDIIIAKKGRGELLGYGIVTSDYFYDPKRNKYQKTRKVDWKSKGNWKVDFNLVIKTLTDITRYKSDRLGYEMYYEELLGIMKNKGNLASPEKTEFPLNTIFYGPPGTGKTFNTVLRAAEIIENRKISSYDEAKEIFKKNLHGQIEFITFHQNYSYEDFIQGLRPETENDSQLTFTKKDGVFKIIADRALRNLKESEKAPEQINELNAFKIALEKLKDQVIESKKPIAINETAYFVAVEEDAFRYSADNWTLKDKGFNGFRMKFSDLEKFFEDDITERRQIKDLASVSGLAKQHATYFLKAYQLVKKMMTSVQDSPSILEKKNYVIIIDEINRANISRVFGELITLIEPDKRSHGEIPIEARLPSGDLFIVPSNLYIIGTMNTADKSIALLDIALRRRFEFEPMYPKYEIDGQIIYDVEILKKINEKIINTKGHDFQIGHAYFMGENKSLIERMNKKVIPLLLEYYMNDEKEVKGILQSAGLIVEEYSWPIRITGRNDKSL